MSTPVFRRIANPLSIWIALLAIVLQSVMPMVAQARMRVAVPVVVVAAAHADCGSAATVQAMPVEHGSGSMAHSTMAGHGRDEQVSASQLATTAQAHGRAQTDVHTGASPPIHAPANPHAMHGDAPCPYCRVHLDAVALPRLPNPHWVLLVSVVHRAIEVEALPALPEAWSPTRPRGPPVWS